MKTLPLSGAALTGLALVVYALHSGQDAPAPPEPAGDAGQTTLSPAAAQAVPGSTQPTSYRIGHDWVEWVPSETEQAAIEARGMFLDPLPAHTGATNCRACEILRVWKEAL